MFNFVYALFDTVKSSGTLGELKPDAFGGILLLIFVFLFLYFVYAFRKIKDYIKERKSNKKDNDKRE